MMVQIENGYMCITNILRLFAQILTNKYCVPTYIFFFFYVIQVLKQILNISPSIANVQIKNLILQSKHMLVRFFFLLILIIRELACMILIVMIKVIFSRYVHCIDVITGMNLPRTLHLSFEPPRNNNLDVINRPSHRPLR